MQWNVFADIHSYSTFFILEFKFSNRKDSSLLKIMWKKAGSRWTLLAMTSVGEWFLYIFFVWFFKGKIYCQIILKTFFLFCFAQFWVFVKRSETSFSTTFWVWRFRKSFYILFIEQISLSSCLYFLTYWITCVLQLFFVRSMTS